MSQVVTNNSYLKIIQNNVYLLFESNMTILKSLHFADPLLFFANFIAYRLLTIYRKFLNTILNITILSLLTNLFRIPVKSIRISSDR